LIIGKAGVIITELVKELERGFGVTKKIGLHDFNPFSE